MKRIRILLLSSVLIALPLYAVAHDGSHADAGVIPAKVAPAKTAKTAPPAKTPAAAPQPAAKAAQPAAATKTAAPAKAPQKSAQEPQQWWQSLLMNVIKTTAALFTPVIGLLVVWLLRKMGLKVDLEKTLAIAEQGRNFAEHHASVALKATGEKTDAAKKVEWAFDLARSVDDKLEGSKKAQAAFMKMLEAAIGAQELKEKANGNGKPAEPAPAVEG